MRVLRDPFGEFVGSGAHRMDRELVAMGARRLGRHHHAGAVSKLGEQRRVGFRKLDTHGVRIDHDDRVDGLELGLPARVGRRLVALEIEAHRLGVERLAVVKGDAGPQGHGQREAVRAPRPTGRELRHIGELGVEIDELVAHGGKRHPVGDARALRRIERRRIAHHADAQRLGRDRRRGQEQRERAYRYNGLHGRHYG
jgi:hypothetical protein